MPRSIIRLMPLLFVASTFLASCAPEPQPQEVHAVSEFDVGSRPAPSVRDEMQVVLATGTGGADVPIYSDIAFFPVVHANALGQGDTRPSARRDDIEPDLSGIDFDSQFGFLVAHPNASRSYSAVMSGQYAKYFSNVRVSYPEDRVVIHLSSRRLGDLDPITALRARWEGSVYQIERRGRDQVEVQIDELAYVYSLDDASLLSTVARQGH